MPAWACAPAGAYAALAFAHAHLGRELDRDEARARERASVVLNVERTWIAVALFAVLVLTRRPFWPPSWIAVIVRAFFQTSLNFSATTMALAGGGAGRTSVLGVHDAVLDARHRVARAARAGARRQWIAVASRSRAHARGAAVELAGRPHAQAVGGALRIRLGCRHRAIPSTSSAIAPSIR